MCCTRSSTKRCRKATSPGSVQQAKELTKRGDAIVKLGVPNGIKAEKVEQFKKNLDEFAKALVKFGADAESGTDADLKTSYSAVHDLFEELAHMLPRKSKNK